MKKIFKPIIFSLLASMAVASCDSYEAPEITSQPAITILSRDVSFPATASNGSIRFKADGAVSVTTENNWITASIEGDEIKVSCTQNNSIASRSGLIVAKCGARTTEISIIQDGMIFQLPGSDAISFTATASSKSFEVKTNAPLEVSSDCSWLSATVEESVLTVNVADNASIDGREGLLTVTYGDNSSDIKVTQDGFYIALFDRTEWMVAGTAASTLSYNYPLTVPVEFTTDSPDWLSCVVNNDAKTLKIVAAKNETGHIREGSFTYGIGEKKGTVTVQQCDFATNLAGEDYGLYFKDPASGQMKAIAATLEKDGSAYRISLPTYGIAIPVTYNSTTHKVTIKGGQSCGQWKGYYIYTTVGFTDPEDGESYYTWSEDPTMDAVPYYEFDEEYNEGYTIMEFEDAETFEAPIDYLQLYAFKSETPASGQGAGYLLRMVNPTLMRVHEAAGEEEASGAPSRAPRMANARSVAAKAVSTEAPVLKKDSVRAK